MQDSNTLTRENINYQLIGLGMQLRYLRDALMCTFVDIPVNYFLRNYFCDSIGIRVMLFQGG